MQSASPKNLCAQNIALLSILHSVPTLPASNASGHLHHERTGYILPFTRERGLVSTLAFLINTKVDTNHIPAICINETTTSLNVLLAVNKTTWEDGNQNLMELRRVFDALFVVISDASNDPHFGEDRIFTTIISMCSPRILYRLRFTKKCVKQPIKSVLQEAIRGIQQLNNLKIDEYPQAVEQFVWRSKNVIRSADAWLRHQTVVELKQIVEEVYRLSQVKTFKHLVEAIPNQFMCPSSRSNLINIVGKVSRYREAARYLYRTAKRYQIARNMKTIPVVLPKESFHRNPTAAYNSDLEIGSMLERHYKSKTNDICNLLKLNKKELHEKWATQTQKTLNKSKIHAEIQLVYHCEMNPSQKPPRVICSSKDACFLCNAFILMYGKMYTPRHHGRLYPGWRLPPSLICADLELRFATVLERQVQTSLTTLLARRQKSSYPDPNESTLLTLSPSTSTLQSAVVSAEASRESQISLQESLEQALQPNNQLGSDTSLPATAAENSCDTDPGTHQIQLDTLGPNYQESNSTISISSHTQTESPPSVTVTPPYTTNQILVQGKAIKNTTGIDCYIAGPLELYLEHTVHSKSASSGPITPSQTYNLEWLTSAEVEQLEIAYESHVVDVSGLQGQKIYELQPPNMAILAAHGVAVRISRQVKEDV